MGWDLTPQDRRRWLLGALAAFLIALFLQQSGVRTLLELSNAWSREAELRERIEALKQENAAIEKQIDELQPGGQEVERLARQQLGLARPGEIVIRIPEKK